MVVQFIFDILDKRQAKIYHQWLRLREGNLQKDPDNIDKGPLISIIVPMYNTEDEHLLEMIESVRCQTYRNWELILIDDASPSKDVRLQAQEIAGQDRRVKSIRLKSNLHISGATNYGIKKATGEFIALLDHDDVLHRRALSEVVRIINSEPDMDFIYTDEDKITSGPRSRMQPALKPELNIDFLHSVNYITHLSVIRKSVVEEVGMLNVKYNGAQDWDLILRVIEKVGEKRIHHIPHVLYSWRVHKQSTSHSFDTKPYVVDAQKSAIIDSIKRLQQGQHIPFSVTRDENFGGQWVVKYEYDGGKIAAFTSSYSQKEVIKKADPQINIYQTKGGKMSHDTLAEAITNGDEYVAFLDEHISNILVSDLHKLAADAARHDIAFVSAQVDDELMLKNLYEILGERTELVARLSRRSVARHLYTTCRYNINRIHGGVVLIQVSKLSTILKQFGDDKWLVELSGHAVDMGYRNLYNPYVKVVK